MTRLFYWCGIADVKITLPDDPEGETQAMRELLDNAVNDGR
jgi:hypothetical protein